MGLLRPVRKKIKTVVSFTVSILGGDNIIRIHNVRDNSEATMVLFKCIFKNSPKPFKQLPNSTQIKKLQILPKLKNSIYNLHVVFAVIVRYYSQLKIMKKHFNNNNYKLFLVNYKYIYVII